MHAGDELRAPMVFSPIEKMMIFESVRGVVGAKAGKTLPCTNGGD